MPIIKSVFINFLINLYLEKLQILYIHKNMINFMKNKFIRIIKIYLISL